MARYSVEFPKRVAKDLRGNPKNDFASILKKIRELAEEPLPSVAIRSIRRRKAWWDRVLSGAQTVSLSHVVLPGFIRITTYLRVSDTHIATLACEFGLVVYCNDTDFARFPDVKVVNPV